MKLTKLMKLSPYLELVRPHQWIKNLFVLFPFFFALGFFSLKAILLSASAFFVFTLASSSVYVLNDLLDVSQDKLHPEKRFRPIASGKIPLERAFLFWIILALLSLSCAFLLKPAFFVVVLGYLLMTTAYSLFFKRLIFLDVIFMSLGYVFRVLGGGIAIGAVVTDWMIILVFLFTLFLSISKRRQEIKYLEKKSHVTREVLTKYTIDLIDQLNAIIVPITITAYIVYTFSERKNNAFFIATIPIVVYCFFRYLYLLKNTDFGHSNEDYFTDKQLMALCLLWFLLVIFGFSNL